MNMKAVPIKSAVVLLMEIIWIIWALCHFLVILEQKAQQENKAETITVDKLLAGDSSFLCRVMMCGNLV